MAVSGFNAEDIARNIMRELKLVREQLGVVFIQDIVPRTPVDTGHARRNWQVNWGVPNFNELPGVDRAGANTVQNGLSKIRAGRDRNAFLPLVIENNVPYIDKLNQGSSKQAPPMFIDLAIQRAVNQINLRRAR